MSFGAFVGDGRGRTRYADGIDCRCRMHVQNDFPREPFANARTHMHTRETISRKYDRGFKSVATDNEGNVTLRAEMLWQFDCDNDRSFSESFTNRFWKLAIKYFPSPPLAPLSFSLARSLSLSRPNLYYTILYILLSQSIISQNIQRKRVLWI